MSSGAHPTLLTLLEELQRLDRAGSLGRGPAGEGKFRFVRGRDVGRLTWPGVGTFWLDRAQQEVVAVLIEAYLHSGVPDVGQRHLIAAAGSQAARLAELFDDHPAWGTLVVPGRVAGAYRIAEPGGG